MVSTKKANIICVCVVCVCVRARMCICIMLEASCISAGFVS